MRTLRPRLVLLATLACVVGCDYFQPRTPEEGDSGSAWVTPLIPGQIVQNLRSAIELENFADYQRVFTEDFTFTPDPTDVATLAVERPGESVFDGWTVDVESTVMEQVVSAADSVRVDLTLFEEQPSGSTTLVKYTYALRVFLNAAVTEYQGEAWFSVRQTGNGEWYVYGWQDVVTTDTVQSWGLLKGRTRSL
ncbi:MAG: hypothetical protein R3B81_01080 [bacterium]